MIAGVFVFPHLLDNNRKIPFFFDDMQVYYFWMHRRHMLRHTFATLLYFAGVDILTAKEQLGHSVIKMTLAIYTNLDKQHKRKSMSKPDEFLSVQKAM
jgi:integrase